jgi:glyoxylase-like metal-dependent hydrolase (beta-lactamase superfamily II)
VVATDRGDGATVIDPTDDHLDSYAKLCDRLGYRLRYTLETGFVLPAAKASVRLEDRFGVRRIVPCDAYREGEVLRVGHRDSLRLADLDVEVIGRPGHVQLSVSYRMADRVFVGAGETRDDPSFCELSSDTLVYRSIPRRGTNLGLLGLERGASMRDRTAWRRTLEGDRSVRHPVRGLC